MVLTIHDEIVIEVLKAHAFPWLFRRIRRGMEDHGGRFKVDLPIEFEKTTTTWNRKHKPEWAA